MAKETKLYQVFNRHTKKWHIMAEDPGHIGGRRFIRVQSEPEPGAEDLTSEIIRRDLVDPNGDTLKNEQPEQQPPEDAAENEAPEKNPFKLPWMD